MQTEQSVSTISASISELPIKSDVISGLRELLKNGDEADKCNASRALGNIGAAEAVEDLVSHLHDDDVDVCIDAAEALGRLRAHEVVPQLLDSLKNDPDGELKTTIVKALGEIRDEQAIPLLLQIAESQPEDMIMDSNEDWDDWWDMQQQAIIALGNMRVEAAADVLSRLLQSDDVLDIEQDILKSLVRIGRKGEAAAIEQLASASPLTRRRAALALIESSSPESLKALAKALTDPSEDVRLYALQALVERKADKYLSAIELLKRDRSEKVRQAALLAIAKLSALKGAPAAAANDQLLQDPDAEVRAAYLKTLHNDEVELDDDSLLQHIHSALEDSDEQVMLAALPLFSRLQDAASAETQLIQLIARPKLSDALLIAGLQTLSALGRWNVNISRILTRFVSHPQQTVRLATLKALMDMERTLADAEVAAGLSKTPIDIINETLSGRVVLEVEVNSLLNPPQDAQADDSDDEIEPTVSDEDISALKASAPMSTLEAIMQESQLAELEMQQAQQQDSADEDAEQAADMAEFETLVERNNMRADWLFSKKEEVSVAQDVQRLSARILARLPGDLAPDKAAKIVNSLLLALNAEDLQLQTLAAESIAQIALDNPQTEGIEYAFGGLVTQFHNEQWDLKLACMKALAAIRNRAAIPVIMSALEHHRAALRIQAIESITDLALDGDELLKNAHVPEQPPTLIEWVELLIDKLQDNEPGVRYSAVNNLKRCLKDETIAQDATLVQKAIEHIVQTAFTNQGGRTRDMAQVLKEIEPVKGTARLIELLKELPSSYERRFAIEMLEEMFKAESARLALN